MALSDVLSSIEQEVKILKDKISETDFDEVKQQFEGFKESTLKLSASLSETFKERLEDEEVQAKIEEYRKNISHAMTQFSSYMNELNQRYELTDNLGSAIVELGDKFNELLATIQENYGQQIHSTVEALSHGFKAWADAKPLDDDIQAIKSNMESNIQKLKSWIRKD